MTSFRTRWTNILGVFIVLAAIVSGGAVRAAAPHPPDMMYHDKNVVASCRSVCERGISTPPVMSKRDEEEQDKDSETTETSFPAVHRFAFSQIKKLTLPIDFASIFRPPDILALHSIYRI